ncbi:MAG: hypothetical protein V4672_18775 [Verrucomicrobiota bacterium]
MAALLPPASATPPGLPPADQPTTPLPAWFGAHREYVQDLQRNLGPLFSPGVNIDLAIGQPATAPMRVPIFLVMLQDTPDKDALIAHTQKALFGPRGLQPYLNNLMDGMHRFLDPADFVPVVLDKTWDHYLDRQFPRESPPGVWPLFDDISAALARENRSLLRDHYIAKNRDNQRLGRGRGVPAPDENTIDGCIFIFAFPQAPLHAYRNWFHQRPVMPTLKSASGDSFKVDSYIGLHAYIHNGLVASPLPANTPFYPGYLHHEFLHLFRVPDTYDRDYQSHGCGCWCSMSWGMFGGSDAKETTPVWPGAWVRRFLNPSSEITFLPQDATTQARLTKLTHALSTRSGKKILKLPIPTPSESHERYLLVELRGDAKSGETFLWDEPACPRSFLVWDVDESIGRTFIGNSDNDPWPLSTYPGNQNDDDDTPLVALIPRKYSHQASPPELRRRNLGSSEDVRHFSDIGTWRNPTDVLKYEGWTLSGWNPATGQVNFQYTPTADTPVPPAPAPPPLVLPPSAPLAAPGTPAAPDTPAVTVVPELIIATGTADVVSKQLPDDVNKRLDAFYTYFPEQQRITVEPSGGIEITTMVANNPTKARKSLKEQIQLLDGVLGGKVSHFKAKIRDRSGATTSTTIDNAVTRLLENQKTITLEPYITVADKAIRVTGAPITIEQQPDPAKPADPNSFRIHIPSKLAFSEEQIAALTQSIKETPLLQKTEVISYLRGLNLELPDDMDWQITADNDSGELTWQATLKFPDKSQRTLSLPALGKLGPDTVIKVK